MDGAAWALRKRARGAFSLAFIGWVLVFFDIYISPRFDLLSDVVGYILVAVACAKLEDLHRSFAPVRWLSVMMTVMSLVVMFASLDVRAVWVWAAVVMEVVTIAWFCTAIATAAIERQAEDLAAIAQSRRNWMIGISLCACVVLAVIPRTEMAFIFGIMALVLCLLFLGLVRRAGRFAW